MIEVVEYETEEGRRPFSNWFSSLDTGAALKVSRSVARMENGNFSNVKAVGGGVSELKIDFGPGYRIYFGKNGGKLIILLGGGSKKRQQSDIEAAKDLWLIYKKRKRKGE